MNAITPAQVMDLRTSVKWRTCDGQSAHIPAHIIYSASEVAWMVYVNGRIMAITPDLNVAGYLLRAERQEPGYVARILDPSTPCDLASLSPSDALAERARLASEARKQAAAAQASAAARVRRNQLIPPTKEELQALDIDDLLA